MSARPKAPTSAVVPDALAAMASRRVLVLDGCVDDCVLVEGKRTGLTAALVETWVDATDALAVVWRPFGGLDPARDGDRERLVAALGGSDGNGGVEPGDELDASRQPLDVAGLLRRLFAQDGERILAIVEAADLVLPAAADPASQRQSAAMLAAIEAFEDSRELHALAFLTRNPGSLSAVVTDRVGVSSVRNSVPAPEERSVIASAAFGRPEDDPAMRGVTVASEGLRLREVEMLAPHSLAVEIDPEDARDLVASFRHGHREDPWATLTPERMAKIRNEIRASVFGQERAVTEALLRLDVASSGLELDPPGGSTRKSRLELFLVGPTGVGKNELARALARSIFGDTSAVMTFDMSAFQDPHSGERLFGAPPGYVGHDNGSPLVDRLREQPFTVIVFDEIEKAHPNNWQRLMAAIDEGRVTDGSGVEASMEHAIVIYTSNIGGDVLHHLAGEGEMSTQDVERWTRKLVEQHLSLTRYEVPGPDGCREGLGKPEIWGRLASALVPFDLLREPALARIVERFCATLVESALRNRGVELVVDTGTVVRHVAERLDSAEPWNGRLVRSHVDKLLRRPLATRLQDKAHASARRLEARLDDSGELAISHGRPGLPAVSRRSA